MQFKHLVELTEDQFQLCEIVNKADLVDLDDVIKRLIHCKKALSLANKLEDPADRKKWRGEALKNLNVVRAALERVAIEQFKNK